MNRRIMPVVLIVLVDMIGFGIIIPILQLFAEERFGASNVQATALLAAFAAAQFVAAPAMGRLSDAIGRRPVLILSQFGTLIGFLILGTANSLFALFLGRLIDGVSGGNITTAEAYVNDVTTQENRAKGFGMVRAAYGAGFILGPALGGIVAKIAGKIPTLAAYSQSAPFFLAAFFSLISILATIFWLPESLPAGQRRPFGQKDVENKVSVAEVLRSRSVRLIMAYALLTFLALNLFQSSYALVVARNIFPELNLEDTQFAMSLLLAWTGIVIVATQAGMVGPLVRHFGEQRLLLISAILRIPAFIGMALVHNPFVMAGWVLPMAMGNGLGQPAQQALLCRFSPPKMRGEVLGILTSTSSLAMVLGPLCAGYLLDLQTSAPDLTAAACTFVALFISLPILRMTPAQGRMTYQPAAAD